MSWSDSEKFQPASDHWPDGYYASRPSCELADTALATLIAQWLTNQEMRSRPRTFVLLKFVSHSMFQTRVERPPVSPR